MDFQAAKFIRQLKNLEAREKRLVRAVSRIKKAMAYLNLASGRNGAARRGMSAKTRKKMAASQRRRWEKARATKS